MRMDSRIDRFGDSILEVLSESGGPMFEFRPGLKKVVDVHLSFFDEGLERNALVPYGNFAYEFYVALTDYSQALLAGQREVEKMEVDTARRGILVSQLNLVNGMHPKIVTPVDKLANSLKDTRKCLERVKERMYGFKNLDQMLSKEVRIRVLPNPDFGGEMVYLKTGRVISKTQKYPGRFSVFKFNFEDFMELDEIAFGKFKTIRGALEDEDSCNTWGTVITITNGHKYPWNESVVPVLRTKYDKFLRA